MTHGVISFYFYIYLQFIYRQKAVNQVFLCHVTGNDRVMDAELSEHQRAWWWASCGRFELHFESHRNR